MSKIFTIGTNGKSPKKFFKKLQDAKIDLILDIRLNNKSQLAGFAKGGEDYLGFLLKFINVDYIHDPYFAPTELILDEYHKNNDWNLYVNRFNKLIKERNFKKYFIEKYSMKYKNICFLCAEETDEKCHRRLVAEAIVNNSEVVHL